MGRLWPYYSAWQQEKFQCQHCGWIGNVGFADLDYGSDVASIIECPKCFQSLGVVEYPNLKDTEEAAAQGNAEAIAALPGFRQRVNHNWELLERFEQEKITSVDQLPELEGESLEFTWDFAKAADGEYYQTIRLGERELWRELAFWSNVRRFEQVNGLLKQKYGARFRSLTPTDASLEWLTGDNLSDLIQLSYT
jgi:hypothetical protein